MVAVISLLLGIALGTLLIYLMRDSLLFGNPPQIQLPPQQVSISIGG